MKRIFLLTSLIGTLFLAGIVFVATGKKPFEYWQAEVTIGSIVFKVDVADNIAQHQRGLGGRDSMPEDRGMYFIFNGAQTQSFWMLGMKFPLDIIWINGDTIIGYEKNIPVDESAVPKAYNSPAPADTVLEINAGLIDRYGIKVGDTVRLK